MDVSVRAEFPLSGRVNRQALTRVARRAMRAEHVDPRSGVSIVIVSDRTMRNMNRRFHDIDAPTDVLSFPSDEGKYIGDIIISYERARENARAAKWLIGEELQLLVVHGILHLLGYDDTRPRAKARMWKRQEQILGPIKG